MITEREIDTAILVVDEQNDFMPGGTLPVRDGDQVVEVTNRVLQRGKELGLPRFLGRDWHPKLSKHFEEWPPHCIQETWGAQFHKDLDLDVTELVSKGMDPEDPNSYSEFKGFVGLEGTLEDVLRHMGVRRLIVMGLATDYCVKETVLDALKLGFETYVLADAVRAVDLQPGDGYLAIAQMVGTGAKVIKSDDFIEGRI